MTQTNQNLAIHINHLHNEDLSSVRQALNWFSQHIHHLNHIHLLHLKTRIPAHTLCSSAAEKIYNDEYYIAKDHIASWKEILGIPESNGWIYEGNEKHEIKHFCLNHQFQFIITSKKNSEQLNAQGYFWKKHQFEIVKSFDNCCILEFKQNHLNHRPSLNQYQHNYI